VFGSAAFRESLGHTAVFLAGYIAVTMTAAFAVALLLNRKLKLSGVYISLIFIPWVIADIIAGLVFGLLVVPDYGLFSPFLSNSALFPPDGLSIPSDPAPRPWIPGFPFPPAHLRCGI
jgi:ABC-type sugar transport system permease subunit